LWPPKNSQEAGEWPLNLLKRIAIHRAERRGGRMTIPNVLIDLQLMAIGALIVSAVAMAARGSLTSRGGRYV
jgi:hypothetical protein